MTHEKRGLSQHNSDWSRHWVTCACGKRGYPEKAGAKQALRLTPGGGMSVYRCPLDRSRWHIGHLPSAVKHGELTREALQKRVPNPRRKDA